MSSTASRLDIYNMALGFIGARTIASPNENCNEAIQCELYWDRARRSALRDYPYNFAVQRVQLAETIVPSVYCDEQGRPVVYQHAYALPNKCLKVMRLHRLGESPLESHEFRLETYEGVALILCDLPLAQADIIVDQEDISLWDELFVMAMARKLAFLVSIPILKNNQQKLNELATLYQQAVPVSDGVNNSERRSNEKPDSWLTARGVWS